MVRDFKSTPTSFFVTLYNLDYNVPIEKVLIDPEKVLIDSEEVLIDPEEVLIDGEKVLIAHDNLSIQEAMCPWNASRIFFALGLAR